MDGFICRKARVTLLFRGSLLFTTKFSEIQGTHFINLERMSRFWSHPVVLNMGPLNEESITLTTGPLLQNAEIF